MVVMQELAINVVVSTCLSMEGLGMVEWEKQELGWHTHPVFGGICKESCGFWYVYSLDMGVHGPYRTLREAKIEAEARHVDGAQKAERD
jgi:hypothetical protein